MVLSGSARMNTLVLLISLLGGVSAFGFIGIVLGPVVAAVVTALVESYQLEPEELPPAEAPPAPLPPEPADAYGSGDCFAAGLAFGLAAELEPLDALEFAARCGAGAIAGPGVHAEVVPLP